MHQCFSEYVYYRSESRKLDNRMKCLGAHCDTEGDGFHDEEIRSLNTESRALTQFHERVPSSLPLHFC